MSSSMKTKPDRSLRWAYGLFLFALVAFLITGVLLDSALASVPTSIQRILTIVLIVLPTAAGTLAGIVSLMRPPRLWLASLLAIFLNGLSALFFAFLASFAG